MLDLFIFQDRDMNSGLLHEIIEQNHRATEAKGQQLVCNKFINIRTQNMILILLEGNVKLHCELEVIF